MKKYSILFKTSAILSYLFLFFGLFWTTQFWRNYWEFSSWVGNLIWIRNIISVLFIGLMMWFLVRSGHAYLFRIPRKKGSIIFVVGKSPIDIMEPILCRKKVP